MNHLALGLSTALSLQNLLYAFGGCLLGTLIGVLPGLGPLATISMLLPLTYGLEPTAALIMLAGIFYGSQYGGSTTAILVNLPGETSSVVTMLDGYQMSRRGRAGAALATAALASFFAGTVGTLLIAALATPLTRVVFSFGPAEYASLMILGLVGAVAMSSGPMARGLGMVVLGLLLGLVGTDGQSGSLRYTFGLTGLWDGIDIVVVAVGLFALTEAISTIEANEVRETFTGKVRGLWPSRAEIRQMAPAVLRGTSIGSAIGVLPGAGLAVASFLAYGFEKRISRTPERFGKGAIEGVAAPEAANNAAAQTAFVPTLMLGIPGSATMALIVSAMIIHNIQPGPQILSTNPELFWGLVVSMWIGNAALLILNLPLVSLWVQLLKVPYHLLYPAILVFACIGVYSVEHSVFDLFLTVFFGFVGYGMRKLNCEPAPLVLGLVLAPLLEQNFRRALLLSRGDYSTFVTSPVSAGLLALAAGLALYSVVSLLRQRRQHAGGTSDA
jgi:TctA family transporter